MKPPTDTSVGGFVVWRASHGYALTYTGGRRNVLGMKTRAALAATLAGLSLATLAAPGAQAAPRPVPTMLIVSVHTDDEMTMSSVWTNRTDVKKVFLWLDVTEKGKTRALQPGTRKPARWNPGEYNPMDFKGGLSSGYYRGSLLNINALSRRADNSLPRLGYDFPTKRLSEGGRNVTTWIDPRPQWGGGAIKYGYQGHSVTPENTRRAIEDVTRNPAKFGLSPNTKWVDLVASNYYNRSGVGGAACDTYANPWHANANVGVDRYAYPQFSGRKYYSMCKADKSKSKTMRRVPANVLKVGYGPGGTIPYYFGWLYSKALKTDTTRSGVFSAEQWFAQGPAKAGQR